MSTSSHSTAAEPDIGSENEAPLLSALFLVKFDQKVGCVSHCASYSSRSCLL
jgi:hypothetical protein